MKLSKEIRFGLLIFLGIILLFFILKLLGLEKLSYLRVLNGVVLYYFINRVQQLNLIEGKLGFVENFISLIKTSLIGVVLSIIGLIVYVTYNGGQQFLNSISQGFLFGKNPSVNEYCFGLFIEGMSSVAAICFVCIQSWKRKSSRIV
jgi:hypothetical protein